MSATFRRAAKRSVRRALGDSTYEWLESLYWLRRLRRLDYPYEARDAVASIVSSGDTVVDVGANVGQYTVLLAGLVGAEGRVVAFEPVPRTLRVLRDVVAGLRLSNVEPVELALGDFDGRAGMQEVVDGDGLPDPGLAHLTLESPGTALVPVARLDSVCDELGIETCSFMKVDVEGAELLVLRGAESFLRTRRPVLLVEIDRGMSARYRASPEETLALLARLGYEPAGAERVVWDGPSTLFYPATRT